jgi:uncharacterized membrane protein (DUF485 family)
MLFSLHQEYQLHEATTDYHKIITKKSRFTRITPTVVLGIYFTKQQGYEYLEAPFRITE